MAWSKKSILSILSDSIIDSTGTTVVNKEYVKITSSGKCSISRSYDNKKFSSEALKVVYKVYLDKDSESNYATFRYSDDVYIDVKITYYKEDSSDIGIQQVFRVFPYNYFERSSVKKCSASLPLLDLYVKSIKVTAGFNQTDFDSDGKDYARIDGLKLYKKNTTSEDVTESVGITNTTLNKVETFNNGCKIYYESDEEPVTLKFIGNEQGELVKVMVNPNTDNERIIEVAKGTTDLPTS